MDELEQTLNRVLSDPAELEKLTRLAGKLMGGGGGEEEGNARTGDPPGLAGALLGAAGLEDGKARLIQAMTPYLGEERGKKLRKAARLAKVARLAGTALGETGGWEDV